MKDNKNLNNLKIYISKKTNIVNNVSNNSMKRFLKKMESNIKYEDEYDKVFTNEKVFKKIKLTNSNILKAKANKIPEQTNFNTDLFDKKENEFINDDLNNESKPKLLHKSTSKITKNLISPKVNKLISPKKISLFDFSSIDDNKSGSQNDSDYNFVTPKYKLNCLNSNQVLQNLSFKRKIKNFNKFKKKKSKIEFKIIQIFR